jgi:hypothetical protein
MPRALKVCVLLAAIFATLAVSAASASAAHSHPDSPKGCDLCFTAHLAAQGIPAVHPVHAPEIQGRAILLPLFFGYELYTKRTSCSRGPPSLAW